MGKEKPDESIEHIEACCAHCRAEIDREPAKAQFIMERCLFETKVTEYETGGALIWD